MRTGNTPTTRRQEGIDSHILEMDFRQSSWIPAVTRRGTFMMSEERQRIMLLEKENFQNKKSKMK